MIGPYLILKMFLLFWQLPLYVLASFIFSNFSNLPAKSPTEEKKHRKQYEAMVAEAKKKGERSSNWHCSLSIFYVEFIRSWGILLSMDDILLPYE